MKCLKIFGTCSLQNAFIPLHNQAYVYQDAVFFAIYNNTSSTKSTLRLYLLLRNTTSLVNVQEISGYQLQDCTFFESYGYFYMALAIQLGPKQYVKDVGMQCV